MEAEIRCRDVLAHQRLAVDASPDVPVGTDVGDARADVAVGALHGVALAQAVGTAAVEQAADRFEDELGAEGLIAAADGALEDAEPASAAVPLRGSRDIAQEQVNLIPDAKEYQDGDVAEIMVQAPFYPAQGLMTVRRSGIVTSERFELKGPTTTLKVPIKDAYVPNVYVQVDLVGKAARIGDDGQPAAGLPDRPAYGVGVLNLPV